jgi:hypothetical protein
MSATLERAARCERNARAGQRSIARSLAIDLRHVALYAALREDVTGSDLDAVETALGMFQRVATDE